MVHAKAVAGKLLAFVLAVVLAVLVPCIPGEAAVSTNVPGLTWANDSETKSIPITMRVPVADCEKSSSTYYYDTFYEGDFYFNFYANGNVTPYLSTNLNYQFDVTPSTALDNISILSSSYTYTLIVAGAEYALPEKGGWLNLISANVINSYITLKVHFAGIVRLDKAYYNYQKPLIEFNSRLEMRASLVTWNCHQNTDTVYENYKMLQQLVNGNEGIKGAIEEGNKLQEQGNQLQEEENRLQEEANETSKGILDKITDFFGNFFKNLGDFLLGLIVPSSEELSAFLEEVNDWFGDRLGFIWYPFDLALRLVDALAKGDADTSFQIPPLELQLLGEKHVIYPGSVVDLDAFGFFKYVRMFTSFLLVSGVVRMAVKKWDEWIGGHTG